MEETKTKDLRTCVDHYAGSYTKFHHITLKSGDRFDFIDRDYNNIVVVLDGDMSIGYDAYEDKHFTKDEIIFIPAYADSKIVAVEDSRILVGTFELWSDVYTSQMMDRLLEIREKTEFNFTSVPIRSQMKQYLDLLIMYLDSGLQCSRLHEIKEKEIFLIFIWFYSEEEIVQLFYPVISRSLNFRSEIIKQYESTENVDTLASLVGMSRSKFDVKFREVFGMSAKQWILKRKAENVKYMMSKPNITISDIMIRYNFSSFTHFNRFCRQHFGASPSELLNDIRSKEV